MRRKEKAAIETVEYLYVGSDRQFSDFIRTVIRDYVSDDKIMPDKAQKLSVKKRKTSG